MLFGGSYALKGILPTLSSEVVLRNDIQSLVDASNLLLPVIYYRWINLFLISRNGRSDVLE
jgi:hypothetical protein